MLTVDVIEDPATATVALDPLRARMLAELLRPASAATLAARAVREVGLLVRRAERTGRRLPTLAVDADISFAGAEDQARFAEELTTAVARLAAKYHRDGGRPHRRSPSPRRRPDRRTPCGPRSRAPSACPPSPSAGRG